MLVVLAVARRARGFFFGGGRLSTSSVMPRDCCFFRDRPCVEWTAAA